MDAMMNRKAVEILERKIQTGRASAAGLFERVLNEAPRDALVKSKALSYGFLDNGGLKLTLDNEQLAIHPHALGQIASRVGVPGAYLKELAGTTGWEARLAAHILSSHFENGEQGRYLLRRVGPELRGFLSDKYRRLDSRPLMDAFITECRNAGLDPVDGTATDTRVALKAIHPEVFEPVPGEAIAFGIEWSNSDFGAGVHAVRAFILRLWCLNGATMENALAQVHLGGRIADEFEFSQRTYELDTAASISALRDVVKGTMAPSKLARLVEGIKAADAKKIDWKNASTRIAKRLLKSELDAAKAAFEGEDVLNLPAGKSVWRMSNALSWIAGTTTDADRKLELQRLAGEVLHGKAETEVAT